MDELLARWCADLGVIGASAAVRRPGRADRFAAHGRDGVQSMRCTGRFRIASITKTFTSALVLRMIARDRLSFDDTLDAWFPAFPNAAAMTIRMLLEHTSGTADAVFDDFGTYVQRLLGDLGRTYAPHEVVELAAGLSPFAEPGAVYRYSNTDYALLGAVAERVGDAAFGDMINAEFASPLGLEDTAYELTDHPDLLHGWFDPESTGDVDPTRRRDLDTRALPCSALLSLAFAAGGMTSSLRDLLTWGDSLYLGTVLSPADTTMLLRSPHLVDPDGSRHGYGVFEYCANGEVPLYGHTGNIIGSSTFLAAAPSERYVVVVHANVLEVPPADFVKLARALVTIDE